MYSGNPAGRLISNEPGTSFPGGTLFGDRMRKSRCLARQRHLHFDKNGRGILREVTNLVERPDVYLDAAIVPAALVFTWAAINAAA